MRHSNSGRKLSRTPSHRKALLHNLAKALLQHGRIRTTEMKAKELRGVVEPLISLAKRNDLHARRQAYRVLCDHALVKRLFDEIGPLFGGVPGGYTRIMSLTTRSTPFCTPMAQMPEPMSTTSVMPSTCVPALPSTSPKKAPTCAGCSPLNAPDAVYQQ